MEALKVVATNAGIAGHYGRFVYAEVWQRRPVGRSSPSRLFIYRGQAKVGKKPGSEHEHAGQSHQSET